MPPKTPSAPTAPQVLAEMEKVRARGRGRRSPLYAWLRENHDQLAEGFARTAPAWEAIATYLGTHGIRDGDGNKPSIRGTREAWYRVKRDLAANRPKGQAPGVMAADGFAPGIKAISTPPVPAVAQQQAEVHGEDQAASEPDEFRVATPRGWTPPKPQPVEPARPATTSQQRRDPDEVIARLLARPKHNAMPMPAVPEPEDE